MTTLLIIGICCTSIGFVLSLGASVFEFRNGNGSAGTAWGLVAFFNLLNLFILVGAFLKQLES